MRGGDSQFLSGFHLRATTSFASRSYTSLTVVPANGPTMVLSETRAEARHYCYPREHTLWKSPALHHVRRYRQGVAIPLPGEIVAPSQFIPKLLILTTGGRGTYSRHIPQALLIDHDLPLSQKEGLQEPLAESSLEARHFVNYEEA
jgi:hypothetical protein